MCSPVLTTPYDEWCVTRTRSVPCKARGVRNNHNKRNAFIEIPANPTHGLILVCSHADCFNSGRRFRYCAVCQTPVAKRNFMLRHGHGLNLVGAARTNEAAAATAVVDCVPSTPPHRYEKRRSRCVSPDSNAMALIMKQAMQELGEELAEAGEERPKKTMKLAPSDSDVELTLEEKEWLSLHHDRPNFQGADAGTKWLDIVIDSSISREFKSSNDQTKSSEFSAPDSLFDNGDELSDPGYKDDEEINKNGDDFGLNFESLASSRT